MVSSLEQQLIGRGNIIQVKMQFCQNKRICCTGVPTLKLKLSSIIFLKVYTQFVWLYSSYSVYYENVFTM